METDSEHTKALKRAFSGADVFTPKFTLKARWVSGQRRVWREYSVLDVKDVKGAVAKAEQLIDDFLPIVRVEIYADGRFVREVP